MGVKNDFFQSKFYEYDIEVGSIDAESDGLGLNLGSTSVTPGKLQ